jgi:hypothetical protein
MRRTRPTPFHQLVIVIDLVFNWEYQRPLAIVANRVQERVGNLHRQIKMAQGCCIALGIDELLDVG